MEALQQRIDALKQSKNPENYLKIGELYLQTNYKDADCMEAYKWIKKAADSRVCKAQYALARMCFDGSYFEQDYATALKNFELSAWQNYGPSYVYLGYMHREGLATRPDHIKAHQMFAKARLFLNSGMRNNDPEAFVAMGLMFKNEYDCDRDYAKAREYFERAAALDSERGNFELGLMYANGWGVDKDINKAYEYFRKGVRHAPMQIYALNCVDNELATTAVGVSLVLQGHLDDGFNLLFRSKYSDIPEVAFCLGYCLYSHNIIDEHQSNNAQFYLTKAFNAGYPAAGCRLADIYELSARPDLAIKYYKQAAEQKDDLGQYSTALAKLFGVMTPLDKPKALELLRDSAKQHFAPASFVLGLEKAFQGDYVKARDLFKQALADYDLPEEQMYRKPELINLVNYQTIETWIRFTTLQIEQKTNSSAYQYLTKLAETFQSLTQALSQTEAQTAAQAYGQTSAQADDQTAVQADGQTSAQNAANDADKSADTTDADNSTESAKTAGENFTENYTEGTTEGTDKAPVEIALPLTVEQRIARDQQLAAAALGTLLLGKFYKAQGQQEQALEIFKRIVNTNLTAQEKNNFRDVIAEAYFELSKSVDDSTLMEQPQSELNEDEEFNASMAEQEANNPDQNAANNDSTAQAPMSAKEYYLAKATLQHSPGLFNYRNYKRFAYGAAYFELLQRENKQAEINKVLDQACNACYVEAALFLGDKLLKQGSTDYPRLFRCFIIAADSGVTQAHVELAKLYSSAPKFIDLNKAMSHYQTALNLGLSEAALPLAQMYEKGLGCKADLKKALATYVVAANQGYAEAQFKAAEIYLQGKNVKQDMMLALELYVKAANQNHVPSLMTLGRMYENGDNVAKNLNTAQNYYQRAADQGNQEALFALNRLQFSKCSLAEAATKLDLMLENQCYPQVCEFYKKQLAKALAKQDESALALVLEGLDKVANHGSLDAQLLLLTYYAEHNPEKLAPYYVLAANSGYVPAQVAMAKQSFEKADHLELYRWSLRISDMSLQGSKTPQGYLDLKASKKAAKQEAKKERKSKQQAKLAAQQQDQAEQSAPDQACQSASAGQSAQAGHSAQANGGDKQAKATNSNVAMQAETERILESFKLQDLPYETWQADWMEICYFLALCYENGWGTDNDAKQALDWFNRAAELGKHEARFKAAMYYLNGAPGIDTDERKAVNMLQKLTKRKYTPALCTLGQLYISGKGVIADPKQAFTLINQAAELKDPNGMALLSQLYANGTGVQASPKLAQTWMDKARAAGYQE